MNLSIPMIKIGLHLAQLCDESLCLSHLWLLAKLLSTAFWESWKEKKFLFGTILCSLCCQLESYSLTFQKQKEKCRLHNNFSSNTYFYNSFTTVFQIVTTVLNTSQRKFQFGFVLFLPTEFHFLEPPSSATLFQMHFQLFQFSLRIFYL